MKRSIKILVLISIIAGTTFSEFAYSQAWGGKGKPGFWDDWSINGNAGLTSFFGDLSIYDTEIVDKLTKESGPALGGILTKHFSNKFAMSGQLLYGGLKGENTAKTSFEASIIEYNFHLRVNLVNLIFADNYAPVGLDVYAGAGQFLFNVTKWSVQEETTQTEVHNTGTPEFVYFFGAGAFYKITDKIGATADLALRQAQNDKLDDFSKNGNFDYYTHISFGITYYIDSFKKQSAFGRGGSTKGRMPGRLPMRRRR
ncbi:MAG: hypothetical protein K9G76_00600 [Bacteroidales bacterium]|nr:hypothetical protein [Bacteroidales bacterium]MCF8402612.1 hypothetical protein [Bacteroidales bacterium]